MPVSVIDYFYETWINSWCSPHSHWTFSTLSEAKRQCNSEPSCAMVYDVKAYDAKGEEDTFYLCEQGAEIKSDLLEYRPLLYIKTGEYVCLCVCLQSHL